MVIFFGAMSRQFHDSHLKQEGLKKNNLDTISVRLEWCLEKKNTYLPF